MAFVTTIFHEGILPRGRDVSNPGMLYLACLEYVKAKGKPERCLCASVVERRKHLQDGWVQKEESPFPGGTGLEEHWKMNG